jgi:hypothetical protein
VRTPATRAPQSCLEAILESLLISDSANRIAQGFVAYARRPQGEDAGFFSRQVVPFAGGERSQDCLQRFAAFLNTSLALAARCLFRYWKACVNDSEIAIIVQYALVVAVDREYINPEVNVRLQLSWLWESIVSS